MLHLNSKYFSFTTSPRSEGAVAEVRYHHELGLKLRLRDKERLDADASADEC